MDLSPAVAGPDSSGDLGVVVHVDETVAALFDLLAASASVLSEVEYAALVADFESAVAPVRDLRTELDALLAGAPATAGVADLAARIAGHLASLEEARLRLREGADARDLCSRTSTLLLEEAAQLPQAGDSQERADLVAWADEQVAAAAAQAEVRNWVTAHGILSHARDRIAAAGDLVQAAACDAATVEQQVTALRSLVTVLRVTGSEAASLFSRLEEASPPDAAPHRNRIVAAGSVLAELVAATSSTPPDGAVDLADLEARGHAVRADLEKFVTHARGVLNP